jgi:putative ABC transport system ATP-binding protein
VIRFENISIKFNDSYLLQNLDFTVTRGDKVLLYGESGIGKTTVFRLLLGFEQPASGTIYIENKKLDAHSAWELRRNVAYVSQDLDIGSGTVLRIIRSILAFKANNSIALDEVAIEKYLTFFRMKKDILHEPYEKLSGGEKQRIAVVIALLLDRSIFFLDEVTSSLDEELKQKVIRYFTQSNDWTVLSIAHDRDWLNAPGMKVIHLPRKHADA